MGHDGLRSVALMLESPGSKNLESLTLNVTNKTSLSRVKPGVAPQSLLEQVSEEMEAAEQSFAPGLGDDDLEDDTMEEEGGMAAHSLKSDPRDLPDPKEKEDEEKSVGDEEAYAQSAAERDNLSNYRRPDSSQV